MKIEGSISQMLNGLTGCEPECLIGLLMTIDNEPIGKIISIDIDKDIFTVELNDEYKGVMKFIKFEKGVLLNENYKSKL